MKQSCEAIGSQSLHEQVDQLQVKITENVPMVHCSLGIWELEFALKSLVVFMTFDYNQNRSSKKHPKIEVES